LTRVLVAYATRFGSTREVASAIAHELNTSGFDAQAVEVTSGLSPDDYDAFVIGSPMYGGKWVSNAAMFAAVMSERMNGKPVALFSMGTLGVKHPEIGESEHKEFVQSLSEVAPVLNVVSDAVFNGYFERANLPWYLRIIDRFVPTPQGDHRDWAAIQAWTKALTPKFDG
jgi:menaquinone-dependent protoporphyrinogen oxidase